VLDMALDWKLEVETLDGLLDLGMALRMGLC